MAENNTVLRLESELPAEGRIDHHLRRRYHHRMEERGHKLVERGERKIAKHHSALEALDEKLARRQLEALNAQLRVATAPDTQMALQTIIDRISPTEAGTETTATMDVSVSKPDSTVEVVKVQQKPKTTAARRSSSRAKATTPA